MGVIKKCMKASRVIRMRAHPHRIVFHHIPKCGGSAITQPFRIRSALSYHKVDEDAILSIVDPQGELSFFARHEAAFAEKEQLCRYYAFRDTAFIQAHVPWFPATNSEPLKNYKRVTLLREPITRFLSHYFWDRERDNQNGIHLDLEAFLETNQAQAFGSMMTRFLSGYEWSAAATKSEAIEVAVQVSKDFAILGFLDDLANFKKQIKSEFGWHMKFPVENRGTVANYDEIINGPLSCRLREVCAPDIALYEQLKILRS